MTDQTSTTFWNSVKDAVNAALSLDVEVRPEYLAQLAASFPDLAKEVDALLASLHAADEQGFLVDPLGDPQQWSPTLCDRELDEIHSAHASTNEQLTATRSFDRGQQETSQESRLPNNLQIGRYLIEKILGVGGYGVVYLAEDVDLRRRVAIKLANKRQASKDPTDQVFLDEARRVAQIDHPGIVKLLHVGQGETFAWYLVMEYIDGPSLKNYLASGEHSQTDLAKVFILIAEAINHAHLNNIFHCDLKPGNILLKGGSIPCVVDFGLALHAHDQQSQAGRFAGTPPYMSPEQVRGEGHRLDGRTDIWSLGVMLYEALTGVRPFSSENNLQLCDEIQHKEPRPPRQIKGNIPVELERICLRCLSKRMVDRYATAADFAVDLRYWLEKASAPTIDSGFQPQLGPIDAGHIIPRGLRPFSGSDSEFFLDLLPGPRTRDGLPDSLHRWIETFQSPENPARSTVNVLYGPSGSGKSSFLRAGILPRLGNNIKIVTVDAGGGDLESNLLTGLRQICDKLPVGTKLVEICSWIRSHGLERGEKILLVIDQFEQWLHANKNRQSSDLMMALRQCDGEHLQCVVTVRSDFWQGMTRFMEELEVPWIEGVNCGHIDLFDLRHARKVLILFGQAYGCLPSETSSFTQDHDLFLNRAVSQISEDGRVVPVRLALFAEMMKSQDWSETTLERLGGELGVGTAFLVQAFDSPMTSPAVRRHRQAAQAILEELLPDDSVDLKGQSRSREELLAACSYCDKPHRFKELIEILDSQLRLITPVEYFATDLVRGDGRNSSIGMQAYKPSYQLAHDYLVPSLREWLSGTKQATARGRAMLCLDQRLKQWQRVREARYLPSLFETARIYVLTERRSWGNAEHAMMRSAVRQHLKFTVLLVAIGCGLATLFYSLAPPAPLPLYMNTQLSTEKRNASFDRLDLGDVITLGPVLDMLKREQNVEVFQHTLTGIVRLARDLRAQGNPEGNSIGQTIAIIITDLLERDLIEGQRQDDLVRQELFEVLAILSPPDAFLQIAADYLDLGEEMQSVILVNYLSQLELKGGQAHRHNSISRAPSEVVTKEFIKLLHNSDRVKFLIGATEPWDKLSANQLITLFVRTFSGELFEFSENSMQTYLLTVPEGKRTARARDLVEELARLLNNKIGNIVSHSGDQSTDVLVYLLHGINGAVQFEPSLNERVAEELLAVLNQSEYFRGTDVLSITCKTTGNLFSSLPIQSSSALSAAIQEIMTSPEHSSALRCTAAQALGHVVQDEVISELGIIATSTRETAILRLAALEGLARIGSELSAMPPEDSSKEDLQGKVLGFYIEVLDKGGAADPYFFEEVVKLFASFAPVRELRRVIPYVLTDSGNLTTHFRIHEFLLRNPEEAGRIVRECFAYIAKIPEDQWETLSVPPGKLFVDITMLFDAGDSSENGSLLLKSICGIAEALAMEAADNPKVKIRRIARGNLDGLLSDGLFPEIDSEAAETLRREQLTNFQRQWSLKKSFLTLDRAQRITVVQ